LGEILISTYTFCNQCLVVRIDFKVGNKTLIENSLDTSTNSLDFTN